MFVEVLDVIRRFKSVLRVLAGRIFSVVTSTAVGAPSALPSTVANHPAHGEKVKLRYKRRTKEYKGRTDSNTITKYRLDRDKRTANVLCYVMLCYIKLG